MAWGYWPQFGYTGYRIVKIASWEEVQRVVRNGMGKRIFRIGDQFVSSYDAGSITWDVIGIDHDIPADAQYTHSLTLQTRDCILNAKFDEPEALYYAEAELAAGEQIFFLDNKKYKFTTLQAVPVGGQVFISAWDGDAYTPAKIATYGTDRKTALDQNLTVSLVESGDITLSPVNYHGRCRYGSNNYKESAIRQWLNSADTVFAWAAQTNYDRPVNAAPYTGKGFLNLLDPELVAVLGAVNKPVARNTVTDGGGQDVLPDKIFLLSRVEAYGGTEGVTTGESPYPYYSAMAASPTADVIAGRIKNLSGSARYWQLRSPSTGHSHYVRFVNTTGDVSTSLAYNSGGVAPACCIV
jgi:hypothetical protein